MKLKKVLPHIHFFGIIIMYITSAFYISLIESVFLKTFLFGVVIVTLVFCTPATIEVKGQKNE